MTSNYRNIILSVFLLANIAGCRNETTSRQITLAEKMINQGELSKAGIIAANILNSENLTIRERTKIDSILEIRHRIKRDFTLSGSDVIKGLAVYHPAADTNDLLRLEKEHKLDMLVLDGEKRYFKYSVGNIFRLDSAYAKLRDQKDGSTPDSFSVFRVAHSAEVLKKSATKGMTVLPVKMRLKYTLTVDADAVPAGEIIRCWMPFPREGHQRQQSISIISTNPASNMVSPATDLQRTIYLEKIAVEHKPVVFETEIGITSYSQSFHLTPEEIKPYNTESPLYRENTAERKPQIVFSEDIKSLAKRILHDEVNPLLQVRKLFNWINDSVTWASALEYSIMPDIPGFVMKQRHGDCGMQTFLFMSLARSAGIPVKWQSGWMLHPGEVNLHDWCEVYFEGIGWVPLDQSFGLQNSGDARIRDFYITGIDSYRLIVNDDFSRPLSPPKKYLRSEPYDFQRGEVEWKGGNLYFDKWSWHMEVAYE